MAFAAQQNAGRVQHPGQHQDRYRDHAPFGENRGRARQQIFFRLASEQRRQQRQAADPETAGEQMQAIAGDADGGKIRRTGIGGMAGDGNQHQRCAG